MTGLRPRTIVLVGVALGAVFSAWNVLASLLDPLADDTVPALLMFYGPMFTAWALAGAAASRRSGRVSDGARIGALVALLTFVILTIVVIARVNLYLELTSQRPDWQTVGERFRASGFRSFRTFVNYEYVTGAPFKLLVASTIGAVLGLAGGGTAALLGRGAAR